MVQNHMLLTLIGRVYGSESHALSSAGVDLRVGRACRGWVCGHMLGTPWVFLVVLSFKSIFTSTGGLRKHTEVYIPPPVILKCGCTLKYTSHPQ